MKELSPLSKDVLESVEGPAEERFTDWYGFDTENDKKGRVTLACLMHESGKRWLWQKAGGFIKWCDKIGTGERPMVICHNLEYDLVNEFGPLYPYLQLNYLKGRLISAKYGRISFWDSGNHFRMPLADIGETLGIPKRDMDIYDPEYVATDAWITLKVMVKARDYIASLGGKVGATSGSSAVSVWEHMTDKEFSNGPLDSPKYRKGYYGGRTEIFRPLADGAIRGYDINSMYPFCMLKEFPEYVTEDCGMDKVKGMADVTMRIPNDLFVAPLVHRNSQNRLMYPVGIVRGTWTYDEIRFAEVKGAVVEKVHWAMGGSVMVRPFDEFINTLFDKRKASKDAAERLFLKVLMNSLYGKIASKNTVTRTVSKYNLIKSGSKRLEEVRWIDHNRGLLDYNTPPQPYVNVVWGAMITAYSRILLTQHMLNVPPEKLVYCDTDSVYTLNHEIPTSNEIGGMKLEKEDTKMRVLQLKAYQLGDFYRAKGVPRPRKTDDGLVLDFAQEFIEHGITTFMAPMRFRQSIGSKIGIANQWLPITKRMRSTYDVKTLSNGRYFPPVLGEQLELFSAVKSTKRK